MKQTYNNILLKVGTNTSNISQIEIVPKEQINSFCTIDFNTNIATGNITLLPNYNWLKLEPVIDSIKYLEKPKTDKQGNLIDVSLSILINNYDSNILQILETFKQHQFVIKLTECKNKVRIIGNKLMGCKVEISNEKVNIDGGSHYTTLQFSFTTNYTPPYYMA